MSGRPGTPFRCACHFPGARHFPGGCGGPRSTPPRVLDLLAAGQDICWRDDDHSPEIKIQPCGEEHETAAVRVEDPGSSDVSVFLPMNLEEGWIDKQRKLLGQVLKEWPSEVLESSPGAYEWRR
ncbi:DUF5959 family protein [Streptomyces sp. NPDC001966]